MALTMNTPKVSVCVVTYNQIKYIEQCLASLVEQATDFDFEVLVGDDCSKDGTQEVIKKYRDAYPHIVKAFLHEKNMGPWNNFSFVHGQARGKYIAHMDGDDYALPGKLQAQADFLDANADCNFVWHRMMVLNEATGELKEDLLDFSTFPMKFRRADIMRYISLAANSSKMYRASVRDFELPDFDVVDYFANVEQVKDKTACFVNDKLYGVYRVGIGISAGSNNTRDLLCKCFVYFSKKYPDHRKYVNSACLGLLLVELKNRRPAYKLYLRAWLRTFHPFSFFLFLNSYSNFRVLRSPFDK